MPDWKLANKDGATKEVLLNGFPVAEYTEQGMKMVKPLKVLASAAGDEAVRQDQVIQGQLLASATANNSSNVILSWSDTNFHHYVVEWYRVVPTITADGLGLHPSTNGGTTFPATVFYNIFDSVDVDKVATPSAWTGGVITHFRIGGDGISPQDLNNIGTSGTFTTSDNEFVVSKASTLWSKLSNTFVSTNSGYVMASIGPVNTIKFQMQNGPIASGSFRIYGVR